MVHVACALCAVVLLGVRATVVEPPTRFHFEGVPWPRILEIVTVVQAFAMRLVFVPAGLSPSYGADAIPEPASMADPRFVVSACVLAGVAMLAMLARERWPKVTLGIGVYALGMATTLHIAPLPVLFGERFLYLPLVGVALVVADLLGRVSSSTMRRGSQAALITVALVFALQSHRRGRTFHDAESIWSAIVAARPASVQAHVGLATVLEREGRCEEALPHLRFVLARLPGRLEDRPVFGLATSCSSRTGRNADALAIVERWIALHPEDRGFLAMRATLRRALDRPPR